MGSRQKAVSGDLRMEPKPEESQHTEMAPSPRPAVAGLKDPHRDAYFQPGGYAVRAPGPAAEHSPDPNPRLDLWVAHELQRAGLPSGLHEVVVRMAKLTMRDGVEVARRALLAEVNVPEDYHFAIDGILKLIPPLI